MDRMLRERGSVGRRIWRRHRPKGDAPEMDAADRLALQAALEPREPPREQVPEGFFARVARALRREPPAVVVEARNVQAADDAVREILTVSRGAARLEAFEEALQRLTPPSAQHRAVALAFHQELCALAEQAGLDLSLFDSRVEACAHHLVLAGEDERAGTLLVRIGRKHQAAELFVAAGAIDALEEAHASITWEEGGARLQARLAFERFESLFLVGMREEALSALMEAARLWHDNPIYQEILRAFQAKMMPPRSFSLSHQDQSLRVDARWPVVLGRGEEASLRLQSPLLSRAHLRIERDDQGGLVVVDLDSRGGTRVDGAALIGRCVLAEQGALDLAGVVVHYQRQSDALLVWPALANARRTLAALHDEVQVPLSSAAGGAAVRAVRVQIGKSGRAFLVPDAQTTLNGEALKRRTLLLEGDRVAAGGAPWTVARP